MTCPKHQTSTQLGKAAHIFVLFAALVAVGLALSAIGTWQGLTEAGTTGPWTESALIVAPMIAASAAGLLALRGWTVSAIKAANNRKGSRYTDIWAYETSAGERWNSPIDSSPDTAENGTL